MKNFKFTLAALAMLAVSAVTSAQNVFINDQLDNNAQNNGAKVINASEVREVELVGTTVVIYFADGTTDNWQGGWTIFDRFVSGPRNNGALFNYYQVPSSGMHRKVSYAAVARSTCTYVGGANPFQAAVKFKAAHGAGTLNMVSYSSNLCSNFN